MIDEIRDRDMQGRCEKSAGAASPSHDAGALHRRRKDALSGVSAARGRQELLAISAILVLVSAPAFAQVPPAPTPTPNEPATAPRAPAPGASEPGAAPAPGAVAPAPDAPAAAPAPTPEAAAAALGEHGEPAVSVEGEEAESEAVASSEADELGEVIVTARRRNESIQKIPVAISALSGDALESKGAVNLQAFHKEIPSITSFSGNARNTTINIRGLGTGTSLGGAAGLDSGVGFYVDDVYYGRLSQSMLNLIDIDRIEVLRGPQGTLFGRNTTAGAISVITKGPTFTPEGTADLSIGNYAYLQARGSLSGPIIDKKLAGRLSVEAQTRDGFIWDSQLLDSIQRQESFTVRGQLLFQPTSKLKFRLIADFSKLGQSCCTQLRIGEISHYDNGTALAYPFSARIANFGYTPDPYPYDPESRVTDVDRQRFFRVILGGVTLRGDWDLDSHTVTSIASVRAWHTSPRNDGDYTALDIQREGNDDDRQIQVSEELRVASNNTKFIDYVGGLYFFFQHLPIRQRRDYGPQAGEFFIAPGTSGLTPEQRAATLDGATTRAVANNNTLSLAGFGQATWHIIDQLDLTGGLRYTFERKYGDYELNAYSRTDISGLNDVQLAIRNSFTSEVPYYKLDKSWSSLGALATLSWKFDEDKLVFVTYSRGSKSGGLNLRDLPRDSDGSARADLLVLNPETVDHFEIGLKSQWFNHRLTINANVYYTRIRDYQNTVVDLSEDVLRLYITNVGSVRSRGFELEVKARPVQGLNLYAGAAYTLAEYESYKGAQCPWEDRAPGQPVQCDFSGKQLPVAPKLGVSLGGDYTVRLTEGLSGFVGVDYSYRSSYRTGTDNTRYSIIRPVGLVNARVGVKDANGHWDVNVWALNLLDNFYWLSRMVNEQSGLWTGLAGDPRTFGATARYYFN